MTSTPILDLETDPPKQERRWRGSLIALAVLTALVLAPVLSPTVNAHLPPWNGLLWLVAAYIAIAFH